MTTWYVSPTGNGANAGTIDSPIDWSTAFSGFNGKLKPGDTLLFRGGLYKGQSGGDGFVTKFTGPIFIRNYPGEHVQFDGIGMEFGLYLKGGRGAIFWPQAGGCGTGIEVFDSTTNRSYAADGTRPNVAAGVGGYMDGCKLIHLDVHDCGIGYNIDATATNCEIDGCLSRYNGDRNPAGSRPAGHNWYMQNEYGVRVMNNCVSGDSANENLQIYAQGGYASGFAVKQMMMYCADSLDGNPYQYNLVCANGKNQNNGFDRMRSFFPLFPTVAANKEGFFSLNQWTQAQDFALTRSTIIGGYGGLEVQGVGGRFTCTNNDLVNMPSPVGLVRYGQTSAQNPSQYNWDQNKYWGWNAFYAGVYDLSANSGAGALTGGTTMDFAAWQAKTGFDKNSVMNAALPTGKWIDVWNDRYETKRANICITNWDCLDANGQPVAGKSPSVAVDLSKDSDGNPLLSIGDQFVILDWQNFSNYAQGAAPLVSGTYQGGTVTIPMENLPKQAPIGYATPPHTAPLFGTFVVMSPNGQDILNPTPAPQPPFPDDIIPVGSTGTGSTGGGTVAVGAGYIQNELLVVKTNLTDKARAIPDASATTQVTGTATSGEVCKVIGTTEVVGPDGSGGSLNFVQVTFESGVSGWVPDAYLTPAPAGTVFTPTSGGGTTPPPPTPKANLSWGASPTAGVTYSVGRATQSGGPYTTLASGLTQTAYTDPSVAPGGSYWYVVWATNANGDSTNTNEWEAVVQASAPGSGTTTPPPAKPEPPTNLTGTVTWS